MGEIVQATLDSQRKSSSGIVALLVSFVNNLMHLV